MAHTFERIPLYEEVWAMPLTRLGKKYGLSDNGIRKICRALNIPLPVAGHWARIAAGAIVSRIPLPQSTGRVVFISDPPKKRATATMLDADREWLSQKEAFEQKPANKIDLNRSVSQWHPILRELNVRINALLKEVEKNKTAWSRQQALTPAKRVTTQIPGAWAGRQFELTGQILDLGRHHFPLRVSPGAWQRALRILHALFEAAESRGFLIKQDGEKAQLIFSHGGAQLFFRMSERIENTVRKSDQSTELEKLLGPEFIKAPTGELRIYLSANGTELKIDDRADKPLEMQLNDVLIRLFRKIISVKRKEREWAENDRQRETEARARAEVELRRQEALQLATAEAACRRKLLEEAKAWRDANLLRSYLDAVISSTAARNTENSQQLSQWLEWGKQVADELDPISNTVRLPVQCQ